MRYYKDNKIESKPKIDRIINPSHEQILADGWKVYVDNRPPFNSETQRAIRDGISIEGNEAIQLYRIEEIPISERVPFSISRLQGRLQLLRMGMLDQVEAIVSQSPIEVKIYWSDAATWERQSPILNQMAPTIGMTQEQLDLFFIEAGRLI